MALTPEQADNVTPGDRIDIRRPEPAQSNQNRPGKNDDDSDSDEQTQAAAYTPEEVAPMLLVGVIGGMMGMLLPESRRRRRPQVAGPVASDEGTHRAYVTKDTVNYAQTEPLGSVPDGFEPTLNEQPFTPGEELPSTIYPDGVWVRKPSIPDGLTGSVISDTQGQETIVEYIPPTTANAAMPGTVTGAIAASDFEAQQDPTVPDHMLDLLAAGILIPKKLKS